MKFSAALLAGGKSRRMGVDKAALVVDGIPLWKHQLAVLRKLDPEALFISGLPRPEWEECGATVIEDAPAGLGPLGGLASLGPRCGSGLLVVLAVDMPRMTPGFLESLLAACAADVGCVPKIGRRYEPLAAVYPAASLRVAGSRVAAGRLDLQSFARAEVDATRVRERIVQPEEEALFANWNRPEDLVGPDSGQI